MDTEPLAMETDSIEPCAEKVVMPESTEPETNFQETTDHETNGCNNGESPVPEEDEQVEAQDQADIDDSPQDQGSVDEEEPSPEPVDQTSAEDQPAEEAQPVDEPTEDASESNQEAMEVETNETAAEDEQTETAAEASETAAEASETAAEASETAAEASETAAEASETAAEASETTAEASESTAEVSETTAVASETAAETSADGEAQPEVKSGELDAETPEDDADGVTKDETSVEQKSETEDDKKEGDGETKDETAEDEEGKKSGDVFDIEDDGKDYNDGVTPDDDYFKALDPEELESYKENKLDFTKKASCLICHKQVGYDISAGSGLCRHPVLGFGICKQCRHYYMDGEWTKDEEGSDVFCRWCAQGGDLLLCDKCPAAFCRKCIQRNLGRTTLAEINSSDEWQCLICDPKQIQNFRANYYTVYNNQGEFKAKKIQTKKEEMAKRKSMEIKKIEKEMSKSPENFLDEALSEAFNTLSVYQKALEDERNRWIKAKRELDLDIATTITRKLRKIYAITRQNMDLLDKALVTGYADNYPKESNRIHMGKSEALIEESDEGIVFKKKSATPKKKPPPAPPSPKKATPKKKVLPKKKKSSSATPAKPAPAKVVAKKAVKTVVQQKKVVKKKTVVNGKAKAASYVTPSLMAKKKKTSSAAPTKVSSKLFKGKKRTAKEASDDSDIEILETAAAPAKKRKIGPKSRTR